MNNTELIGAAEECLKGANETNNPGERQSRAFMSISASLLVLARGVEEKRVSLSEEEKVERKSKILKTFLSDKGFVAKEALKYVDHDYVGLQRALSQRYEGAGLE